MRKTITSNISRALVVLALGCGTLWGMQVTVQAADTKAVDVNIRQQAPVKEKLPVSEGMQDFLQNKTIYAVGQTDSYARRLSVQVTPVLTQGADTEIVYPSITSVSKFVSAKINDKIYDYVEAVEKKQAKLKKEGKQPQLSMAYDIKANDKGILSIVIYTYQIEEKAANGMMTAKAFTFNTATGRSLARGDFGSLSVDTLNQKIEAWAEEHPDTLYKDFKGVTEIPKEFYADEEHTMYILFQPTEIGPHSSSVIIIPVGKLAR